MLGCWDHGASDEAAGSAYGADHPLEAPGLIPRAAVFLEATNPGKGGKLPFPLRANILPSGVKPLAARHWLDVDPDRYRTYTVHRDGCTVVPPPWHASSIQPSLLRFLASASATPHVHVIVRPHPHCRTDAPPTWERADPIPTACANFHALCQGCHRARSEAGAAVGRRDSSGRPHGSRAGGAWQRGTARRRTGSAPDGDGELGGGRTQCTLAHVVRLTAHCAQATAAPLAHIPPTALA